MIFLVRRSGKIPTAGQCGAKAYIDAVYAIRYSFENTFSPRSDSCLTLTTAMKMPGKKFQFPLGMTIRHGICHLEPFGHA